MSIIGALRRAYTRYGIVQRARFVVADIISCVVIAFLFLLRPLKPIRLFRTFNEDRIGHLAMNTDLFLRRLQLHDPRKKNELWIGFASTKPANKQLLTMFIRAFRAKGIPVVKMPPLLYETFIKIILDERSLFGKSSFFVPMSANSNEYYEFNNTKCNLSFTDEEEKMGADLLRKMGIPEGAWFVCIHARNLPPSKENPLNVYRNCSIQHFMKAAEYITSLGGYAVRMGDDAEEELNLSNPRIIDYAKKYRFDFGDIYLPAKCKFFLGSNTGLIIISEIFHVPLAETNFPTCGQLFTPFRSNSFFLLKKLWSTKENRFLTFRETLEFEKQTSYKDWKHFSYEKHGLRCTENSPDEILDLAKEMNERIDGTWKTTKEDEELQQKFKGFITPEHRCYGTSVRIGTLFLKKNKFFLE